MNARAKPSGLTPVLKSLNGDHAYGASLLAACLLLGLLELGGEPVRAALRFDRPAIAAGEWWRVLGAHFVHLDGDHLLVNVFGVVLMWALFARDYSPLRWAAIYFTSCLAIGAGLWFLDGSIDRYVGASGALHGVMAAGTLAHLRRRDLDGWILAIFIIAKLTYEQIVGALPFMGAGETIVDAHLYGAIGGLAMALLLESRRQPVKI